MSQVNTRPLIYFAASIRGGRLATGVYAELIAGIGELGQILTVHIADPASAEAQLTDGEIFDRDVQWLAQADAVVAEVTVPSLGVGYELGRAEALQKPALCIYRPGGPSRISAMLTGNPAFSVKPYTRAAEAVQIVQQWLEQGDLPSTESKP